MQFQYDYYKLLYTHVLEEMSQLPEGWKNVIVNDYHALRSEFFTEASTHRNSVKGEFTNIKKRAVEVSKVTTVSYRHRNKSEKRWVFIRAVNS